jgi:hypothetical protein
MITRAAYQVEKCDRQTDGMDDPIRYSSLSLEREERLKRSNVNRPIIGRK